MFPFGDLGAWDNDYTYDKLLDILLSWERLNFVILIFD